MKKAEKKRRRRLDADRQKAYQSRLKAQGKSQFKVTLSKEATEQFEFFTKHNPNKSKSQVLELVIAAAFNAIQEMAKEDAEVRQATLFGQVN